MNGDFQDSEMKQTDIMKNRFTFKGRPLMSIKEAES